MISQNPNNTKEKLLKNIFYLALYSYLLITFIVLFVPFFPGMLEASPDGSWVFALSQAVFQHLEFGKDIIFSFGPYSFLYSYEYHPYIDNLALATGLYLALAYFACFFFVSKGTRPLWSMIFCIGLLESLVMNSMFVVRDSLLLSYPLLLGLAIFKMISAPENSPRKNTWQQMQVALLFTPLGLLALAKGTMLLLSLVVVFLSFFFFIVHRRYYLAIIEILSFFISTFFFWWLIGQKIIDLPIFC